MRHLTPAGLAEDGSLVLVGVSGEQFSVTVDARLRAALRGAIPRLRPRETTTMTTIASSTDSALRPRDIQARIRAGESPEAVAAAAQITVERIMPFAAPVLAERAHIAQVAQRASVRLRGGAGGPAGQLSEAVQERLRARDVDPESVDWDAWRREDGRWLLVADYRTDDSVRHARFAYDIQGRYVVAEDDEARWLLGEGTGDPGAQTAQASGPVRRLSAVVPPGLTEDPLLGADTLEMVREEPATGTETEAPETVAPVDAGEPVTQVEESARSPRRSKGRASVPSWDDIMFGSGKAVD